MHKTFADDIEKVTAQIEGMSPNMKVRYSSLFVPQSCTMYHTT